jgi:hypothetical protein
MLAACVFIVIADGAKAQNQVRLYGCSDLGTVNLLSPDPNCGPLGQNGQFNGSVFSAVITSNLKVQNEGPSNWIGAVTEANVSGAQTITVPFSQAFTSLPNCIATPLQGIVVSNYGARLTRLPVVSLASVSAEQAVVTTGLVSIGGQQATTSFDSVNEPFVLECTMPQ